MLTECNPLYKPTYIINQTVNFSEGALKRFCLTQLFISVVLAKVFCRVVTMVNDILTHVLFGLLPLYVET